MAGVAGIGHFGTFRQRRGDESKRVAADHDVSDGLLDLRHVAVGAFVSWTISPVVRVLFDGSRMRPEF